MNQCNMRPNSSNHSSLRPESWLPLASGRCARPSARPRQEAACQLASGWFGLKFSIEVSGLKEQRFSPLPSWRLRPAPWRVCEQRSVGKSELALRGPGLPFGTLCPLPHYLLFIWCLLESWYWSDHRLVRGTPAVCRQKGVGRSRLRQAVLTEPEGLSVRPSVCPGHLCQLLCGCSGTALMGPRAASQPTRPCFSGFRAPH